MITETKIFDTHAHLMDPAFEGDRAAILSDLGAHGIGGFTEIGFDLPSSEAALALSRQEEMVYAAVGIHPDHSEGVSDDEVARLRQWAETEPKVVAIGEIGLDYHYTREGILRSAAAAGKEPDPELLAGADPDPEIQKATFRRMLQLAREVQLPINVHSRDAAQDTYELIVEEKGYAQSGIIHCFGYSVEMAERFVKLGLYIGVGGVVTFKNSRKLKEVVERIPIERIVLETDCPYMAPVPLRGTRNDPRNLPYVVEEIARLRGMEPAEVVRITTENAKRVYRIPEDAGERG